MSYIIAPLFFLNEETNSKNTYYIVIFILPTSIPRLTFTHFIFNTKKKKKTIQYFKLTQHLYKKYQCVSLKWPEIKFSQKSLSSYINILMFFLSFFLLAGTKTKAESLNYKHYSKDISTSSQTCMKYGGIFIERNIDANTGDLKIYCKQMLKYGIFSSHYLHFFK